MWYNLQQDILELFVESSKIRIFTFSNRKRFFALDYKEFIDYKEYCEGISGLSIRKYSHHSIDKELIFWDNLKRRQSKELESRKVYIKQYRKTEQYRKYQREYKRKIRSKGNK